MSVNWNGSRSGRDEARSSTFFPASSNERANVVYEMFVSEQSPSSEVYSYIVRIRGLRRGTASPSRVPSRVDARLVSPRRFFAHYVDDDVLERLANPSRFFLHREVRRRGHERVLRFHPRVAHGVA